MTDKVQKIKEWISKEQDGLMDAQGNFEYPSNEGAFHILSRLDHYIDSLQEEPVSEDLEEVAEAYALDDYIKPWRELVKGAFKAGAKWQEQQDQSTIELAEDHAMFAGMEKMKEEMMVKAVNGKVIANGMGNPILHLWDKGRDLIGKKVKVIVIKED